MGVLLCVYAESSARIGSTITRIELNRLIGEAQRFLVCFPIAMPPHCVGPQDVVIGIELVRRLSLREKSLLGLEPHIHGYGDAFGNAILQREYVVKLAVELVCPQVDAGCRFDQLSCNAHAAACLAHAAFDHIAYAQFAADLLDVDRLALIGEARIAGYDEQRPEPRQCE